MPAEIIAFWALAAISGLAALAYGFVFLNATPSMLRALVKTAFMAALAGAVLVLIPPLFHGPGLLAKIFLCALVASAAGDFFLAFDKKWALPLGILSFLIAQLSYFFLFRDLAAVSQEPIVIRYAASATLIVIAVGFLIWLRPKLGALAFGVVPYSLAITAMAVQAMWLPWSGWPAMLGVVSFFVSDGVLSGELFMLSPEAPARRITASVVWWTYVAAQVLIVSGILILIQGVAT